MARLERFLNSRKAISTQRRLSALERRCPCAAFAAKANLSASARLPSLLCPPYLEFAVTHCAATWWLLRNPEPRHKARALRGTFINGSVPIVLASVTLPCDSAATGASMSRQHDSRGRTTCPKMRELG